MDEFLRQDEIFVPGDVAGRDLDLVGAGALGGAILLVLTKMGFGVTNRITLTDFDRCESHNLSNQWFRQSHVLLGQSKVEALAEMVAWLGDRDLACVEERFTGAEGRRIGPLVVLAVDSLEERGRIWANLRRREDVRFVIDARMGAHVLEIHAIDLSSGDDGSYERSLRVAAGDAYEERCGDRAIFYTVLGGAAFVGSILRAWCRGEPYPRRLVFDFRNFLIQAEEVQQ